MRIKSFPALLEQVPEMLSWVRSECTASGLKSFLIQRLEVVAEEAIANIIFHTYKRNEGKIEIVLDVADTQIQMIIRDWGPPYNPLLLAPKVDVDASLEEREEGGLGVHLMRELVDQIHYRRDLESNVLSIVK